MDSNKLRKSREDDNDCQLRADAEDGTGPERPAPQASAPRCPGNTEGDSSHELRMEGYPEYLIAGGIDWFEWSALVDWSGPHRSDPIFVLFQKAKEKCQSDGKPYLEVFVPEFGPVRVSRIGLNRGKERGQHFEYCLQMAGMKVGVSPRNAPPVGTVKARKRPQPNFYAVQTGRECLLIGALQGYEVAEALLTALGGVPLEKKLSRGDLCLDIRDLDATQLLGLVENGHFVTRASHVRPNVNYVTGRATGFSAGQSPMYLTVYDKGAERLGKADQLYNRALVDRRWYGIIPRTACRVEYQMCRRWLVEQGIGTPEDFLNRRGALCQKLTHDWFRVTARRVDRRRKHQSRADMHPIWRGIQLGFATIFGKPEGCLTPILRDKITAMELAKQGRGCLANGLLQMDMRFETYEEFAEMCKRFLLAIPASRSEAQDFMAELERRKMEFETS